MFIYTKKSSSIDFTMLHSRALVDYVESFKEYVNVISGYCAYPNIHLWNLSEHLTTFVQSIQ